MTDTSLDADTAFSAGDFIARARDRLTFDLSEAAHDLSLEAPRGDHVHNPGLAIPPELLRDTRLAAVLIPVIRRPGQATVLLTLRTEHLPSHAGQVAFPGGKIEPDDATPLAAALREADEEIGLTAPHVEPLGYMHPYQTTTGYRIIPVVAAVDPGFTLKVDESEVADVFEVPLRHLMTPANHQKLRREWHGNTRYFFAMPYEDRYIWGVTAGIIRELYLELYG